MTLSPVGFGPLGPLDAVQPGDIVAVTIDVAGIIPFVADMHTALAKYVNVLAVERGLFQSEVKVTVRVAGESTAGELGSKVAAALEEEFVRIVDADPVRYERLRAAPGGGGSGGGGTSVTTTISLASLAVLGVVALVFLREVKRL